MVERRFVYVEVRICGGSYTRRFVYLLILEEVRIQYTNSYTETLLGGGGGGGGGGGAHTHTHTHT